MDGIVAHESKIVVKKGTKEKLSKWYKGNLDKNKEDDQLRNAISTFMDIKRIGGKALLKIYAPGPLAFLGGLALKKEKRNTLKAYDRFKKKFDEKVEENTELEEMNRGRSL